MKRKMGKIITLRDVIDNDGKGFDKHRYSGFGFDKHRYSGFLRLSAWLGLIPLIPIFIMILPFWLIKIYIDYRVKEGIKPKW